MEMFAYTYALAALVAMFVLLQLHKTAWCRSGRDDAPLEKMSASEFFVAIGLGLAWPVMVGVLLLEVLLELCCRGGRSSIVLFFTKARYFLPSNRRAVIAQEVERKMNELTDQVGGR